MLSKVFPHELGDEELKYFHSAVDTDDHSGSMDEVVRDIYDGHLELWLWSADDSTVIFVTSISSQRDGFKELFITMMSGQGAIVLQVDISDSLKLVAKDRGCSALGAYMKPHIAENMGLIGSVKREEEKGDGDVMGIEIPYVVLSMRV